MRRWVNHKAVERARSFGYTNEPWYLIPAKRGTRRFFGLEYSVQPPRFQVPGCHIIAITSHSSAHILPLLYWPSVTLTFYCTGNLPFPRKLLSKQVVVISITFNDSAACSGFVSSFIELIRLVRYSTSLLWVSTELWRALIDTSWTSKSISKYNGNPNTYMTAGNLVYAKEGYRLDLIVGLNVKASVMCEVLRNGDFRNLVVKPLNRINTKISLLTGDIYEFARRTVRKSC